MPSSAYHRALDDFLANPSSVGWRDLPFFTDGSAQRVAKLVDDRAVDGATVLPPPRDVFNALTTPLDQVSIVILGQDPYPTPGHAHGLAFSYLGGGPLPASLRNIFKELAGDLGGAVRKQGDLSDWAKQGVLLLNTALTVEAGKAGAHMKFGWRALTQQVVDAVSRSASPSVFILWGANAGAYRDLIEARHLVIESAHPSPLSARRGFFGSKPFSRANAFLRERGRKAIVW